jgi:CHAT domain-containing protein
MRCVQNIRVILVIVLVGMFSYHGFCAQNVATNFARTTFEYKEVKSYAELTNSIREVKQQLDSAERTLGGSSTNVADLCSKLASLYDELGDLAQAAQLLHRCLAIREQSFGPEHMDVADALNDLAWEYEGMGDYEIALSLYQRSLTITEKMAGPNHFKVATTLNDMADLFCMREDFVHALPLCQRALAIRQKELGVDHPDVVDSLSTLAWIYDGLGSYSNALATAQHCIAMGEKTLGPDHPLISDASSVLGQIYSDLGNYPEAFSAFQRALAIDEKLSGSEHPDVLWDLNDIARLFGRQHDFDKSISTYVELFNRQRLYFVGQILAVSDRDALLLLQDSFELAESFHSVCAEGSAKNLVSARVAGATALALDKALLEEVRAAQAAFEADPRTSTEKLREQYRSVQSELEDLNASEPAKARLETKRRELQDELSQIESKLSERVGLVAQAVRERNLTLSDIARSLPSQSALVDFIQYRRYDFTARTNQWKEQRYGAYLTFPLMNGSTNVLVERVDLGEAAPINESIALVCKRMSVGQFAAKDLAGALPQLSELVYAPLARHLTNVSHLIICPDGQLSRVPFEMLPVGNKYLVEEKTVSYVTSGREVIRIASPKSSVHSSKSLVMGNPDFNLDLSRSRREEALIKAESQQPKVKIEVSLVTSSPTRTLTRDYDDIKFQPLPGAEAEARSVAKLLGDDAILCLGADAREAELKAVQSPRVLHLATHGFYFPDQEFNSTNSSAKPNQTRRLPYAKKNNWENPMVRCGIALAGANHAMQITNALAEDGLLTGLDASLLNLQGTKLVILSACDSGAGEVKIGEGMMSLRRAFLIAGAQTVLASHWPVSDKATNPLMTEFMRRWRAGEPRAQAWREAQLELLRSKDFSNPYFWSAFTLTGQWN